MTNVSSTPLIPGPRAEDGSVLARWGDDVAVDDFETGGVQLALPEAPSRHPMVRDRVVYDPGAGLFCAPHGIAVDSAGSIYVAESSESWIGLDHGSRSIQSSSACDRIARGVVRAGTVRCIPTLSVTERGPAVA